MRRGFNIDSRSARTVKSVLAFLIPLFFAGCGIANLFAPRRSGKIPSLEIPISVNPTSIAGASLSGEDESFSLAPTSATNLYIQITGCNTGNTGFKSITGSTINLYKSDQNCKVKLLRFVANGVTYSSVGANAVPFTTWLANDTATFQDTASSNTIKVFVKSQVTQAGVQVSDSIVYNFTDVQAATASSLGSVSVQTGVPLSVNGADAPAFTLTEGRLLSQNTTGSGNFSFTLQCTSGLSGGVGTYACATVPLLNTSNQLDYIFIPDAYSQGAITVVQADAAFAANTPTTISAGQIVTPTGNDGNGNTLTNGGFYTPTLTNGVALIVNPNSVLMLRRRDASGNAMSYLYFYVDVTLSAAMVSACGSFFAGGAGTVSDPYQVNDYTTLANTVNCTSVNTFFIQTANIDLGGSATPWTPINLYGQYNGNNFSISNLYVNSSTVGAPIGLFSTMNSGASVSNLTLASVSLTSVSWTGALAGVTTNATISNVSSSGTITVNDASGEKYAGGILGDMFGGILTSSSSSVDLTFNSGTAHGNTAIGLGGVVGALNTSTYAGSVTRSFATGTLTVSSGTNPSNTGSFMLGGLVGNILGSNPLEISTSYSTVNITVLSTSIWSVQMGGIVGFVDATATSSSVLGCFSKGTITATGNGDFTNLHAGGLIGWIAAGTTISNSYTMATLAIGGTSSAVGLGATGCFIGVTSVTTITITSNYASCPSMTFTGTFNNAGGFIGSLNATPATITNNYYNTSGSGVPANTTPGVTSLTTAQMLVQDNFPGLTFGTAINNWVMPNANTFSSPSGQLSPVQYWQVGSNGITSTNQCSTLFAAGAGTSGNPYQVDTQARLAGVGRCFLPSTYFTQTGNIAVSGWTPVDLYGQYDGQGFSVTGLSVTDSTSFGNVGLFSIINQQASVSNLTLPSVSLTVTGNQEIAGALAGLLAGGTVTKCTSSGTISISTNSATNTAGTAGGLIGMVTGGTVSSSSSSVNITHPPTATVGQLHLGAFIGQLNGNQGIYVTSSYATGTISGSAGTSSTEGFRAGGFLGASYPLPIIPTISNSYSTGNITVALTGAGNFMTLGGLVADTTGINISGCFATGTISVTGNNANLVVGGLVGAIATYASSVTNSYSMTTISETGTLSGATKIAGGFIGKISVSTTVSNSYSASPSVTGAAFTSLNGFIGSNTGGTFTNTYLYKPNANVPADAQSGVTTVTTLSGAGSIQSQATFTGFTFGTSNKQYWTMPTANSLSGSPYTSFSPALLSPVLHWQCEFLTATCL